MERERERVRWVCRRKIYISLCCQFHWKETREIICFIFMFIAGVFPQRIVEWRQGIVQTLIITLQAFCPGAICLSLLIYFISFHEFLLIQVRVEIFPQLSSNSFRRNPLSSAFNSAAIQYTIYILSSKCLELLEIP